MQGITNTIANAKILAKACQKETTKQVSGGV
jgi:hypothetical protein